MRDEQLVVIVGGSGTGKSTLARSLQERMLPKSFGMTEAERHDQPAMAGSFRCSSKSRLMGCVTTFTSPFSAKGAKISTLAELAASRQKPPASRSIRRSAQAAI